MCCVLQLMVMCFRKCVTEMLKIGKIHDVEFIFGFNDFVYPFYTYFEKIYL